MGIRQRVAVVALAGAVTSCTATYSATPPDFTQGRPIAVVAAESFWGSIAAELGGTRVTVTSLIDRPGTDPHDYEPTPHDARAIAAANYVVLNGVGYDAWARQLVDANPSTGRRVLDVGARLRVAEGENPHRWFFPRDVETVIGQITADYKQLEPAESAYFDQRRDEFEAVSLRRYKDLLSTIKAKYAGTPVGASESIFAGIADATGLDLVTPPAFLQAISEGGDPVATDKATVDRQITSRQIKVFVYNSQNAVPDVTELVRDARAAGVQVATVTESPPPDVSFQDWQADQLQHLLDALDAAGRP